MKLKNVYELVISHNKRTYDLRVEYYATVVSFTIRRSGWELPMILDKRLPKKQVGLDYVKVAKSLIDTKD